MLILREARGGGKGAGFRGDRLFDVSLRRIVLEAQDLVVIDCIGPASGGGVEGGGGGLEGAMSTTSIDGVETSAG